MSYILLGMIAVSVVPTSQMRDTRNPQVEVMAFMQLTFTIIMSKLTTVEDYGCEFCCKWLFWVFILSLLILISGYAIWTIVLVSKNASDKKDEAREKAKHSLRLLLFRYDLERASKERKRRYFWLGFSRPLSYAPWKRSRRLHYCLMKKGRQRRTRVEGHEISSKSCDKHPHTDKDQYDDFEAKVKSFCETTDFLSLHRVTMMFPESTALRKNYEKICEGWRALAPISSAVNRCWLSANDPSFMHPGCVFFSKVSQQDTPIVIDTGASSSVSPFKEDFVSFKESHSTVIGIGARAAVEGHGTVRWTIFDSEGKETTVETEAIYMPSASIRLYSPQAHFRKARNGSLFLDGRGVKVLFPHDKATYTFPHHEPSMLPLMLPVTGGQTQHSLYARRTPLEPHCSTLDEIFTARPGRSCIADLLPSDSCKTEDIVLSVMDEQNANLTGPQQELLAWHYRFGHVSMGRLQKMIRPKGISLTERSANAPGTAVISSNFQQTRSCPKPQCASCNLAKASRTPIRTASTPSSTDGSLKDGDLRPGDCVSLDQIVCPQKGRTVNSKKGSITGGTVFIDHASGFVKFEPQSSGNVQATLVGKHALEREANSMGFRLRSFLTDNGVFKAKDFRDDLERRGQTIHFSGVGGKHQNGVAENGIKTISNLARAMLIHSALRWPAAHDLTLWPLCLQHAVYIWNKLPGADGLSPEEKWTSVKSDHRHLRQLHPWGCPAYVLHPTLQDGKKLPKWKPRSRQGQFVGYSPVHASSVALILNRSTKRISPQFHLLFDDFSTTVRGVEASAAPDLEAFDWESFIDRHGVTTFFDEDDPIPPDTWETSGPSQREKANKANPTRPTGTWIDSSNESGTLEDETNPETAHEDTPVVTNPISDANATSISEGAASHEQDVEASEPDPTGGDVSEAPSAGRGQRTRIPNRRYFNRDFVNACDASTFLTMAQAESQLNKKTTDALRDTQFINGLDWGNNVSDLFEMCASSQDMALIRDMQYHEDTSLGILNELSPLAFSARASAGDTPRWHEALHGQNAEGFWKAMMSEITTLDKLDAWSVVRRTSEMTVLPSTWAFKIKRFPTGLVRKLKARICVMGNRQTDVDPFECYAPVVAWSTVRTMLILSVILNLHTVQVDYTSAFCQAPVHEDIYVSLPRGWKTLNQMGLDIGFKDDHVLKLNRSLYGLKQSPKNFYNHLRERLESIGFVQSQCDPCLFLKGDVTCLVYVDDCLLFSRTKELLDATIEDLKDANMDLSREDDVAGFLGVLLKRNEDGTVTLSQTGLIGRIVEALGLTAANGTRTPAQKAALPRDVDGEEYAEAFNYASVVGMMMYLACNSRPDIAFAVHQCARHTHRPTALHAKYIKQIGRYLQGTKTKGMTINPIRNGELHVECYADADFAGLWGQEDVHDPHCVRSRTGYIIMINRCPILWKSQLQTEIAMSTMEAEYVALSSACRDVIPLTRLVSELGSRYGLENGETPTLKTTLYEDNEGALRLANTELPRMTPRSKHYGVKYHWFREHVQSGLVSVLPVSTKDQLADIFTKGLPFESFERLRERLMGW